VAAAVERAPAAALTAFLGRYRYPIAVWAGSRALTFLAIGMLGWVDRARGSADIGDVFARPLSQWDGIWYLQIAEHGYDPTVGHGNSPAFFPLYPMLVRAAHAVIPASTASVGVLVSTLLLLPALMLLYRLTLERFDEPIAHRTVLYLAISPLSFVFSAVYTESLALLLIVLTFFLMERGRVLAACSVGALAVLARPVGIALAPAIAWRVFDDGGRRVGWRLVWRLLPILLLPLALLLFEVYLWWRTGEVFATHAAESRGWSRDARPLFILLLPFAVLHGLWIAVTGSHDLGLALSAFAAWVSTMLLGIGIWLRKIPIDYAIFCLICLILPAYTGMWLGFPRFGLVLFPLFWTLAVLAGSRPGLDSILRTVMPATMVGLAFVSYSLGTFTP
jgi:hypothetical protein